jgi:hypothetical protein
MSLDNTSQPSVKYCADKVTRSTSTVDRSLSWFRRATR